MADRTQQILPGGQGAAPFTYTIPASTAFTLLGVKATFDGSGAGGNFLPCVQLVSDAGVVMAFGLGSSVAAGGSADVSFAPFLRGQTSGGGTDPNAVHYNVSGETGTFVDSIATTNGYSFWDQSGNGIYLTSENFLAGNGGFIGLGTKDGETAITSTVIVNRLRPVGGTFEVQDHFGSDILRVEESSTVAIFVGPGDQLAIFGLPIVNPGGAGRLWNNGGVVNIT